MSYGGYRVHRWHPPDRGPKAAMPVAIVVSFVAGGAAAVAALAIVAAKKLELL